MLNSHAVKAIKNRRSIIFHDTMYAKDASIAEAKEILMKDSKTKDDGPIYIGNSGPLYKGDKVFNKKTGKKETIEYISSDQIGIGGKYYEPGSNMEAIFEVRDSDPRGYKVSDQIIKGFMIYKSGKPNMFTAKNESGEQYEGTMEEIKAKIDAYWVKRDEDVMKQKDGGPGSGIKGHTTAGKESEKSFQKRHAGFMENIISSHFPEKNKKDQHQKQGEVKQKVNDAIKIVNYKGYEISKNDNDNKFRVFLSGFEVFVPQKSLEAAKALIDKKNSKAKDSKTKDKSPRWRIKDDKMFKLKTAAKKMKDAEGNYTFLQSMAEKFIGRRLTIKEMEQAVKSNLTDYDAVKKYFEEIKAKIDAYWAKRDEDVMKQKDGLTSEDKRQIQESIRRLESKRKEAIKAGKENYLNSEIARLKKALEEPTDFFMRDISDSKTKDDHKRMTLVELRKKAKEGYFELQSDPKPRNHIEIKYPSGKKEWIFVEDAINHIGEQSFSKTKDDIFYQGQQYPAKELHRILANKGKVKEFNELSEKEQKERMDNPFALYESGDNIYAVVRRDKVN